MFEATLWAIWQVEAAGKLHPKDGDIDTPGGPSIGAYQIQRAYHDDAAWWLRKELRLIDWPKFDYERCREKDYAEMIIRAYARRYSPKVWAVVKLSCVHDDQWWRCAEIITRRHNGGPKGDTKKATLPYWAKVRKQMEIYLARQAKEAKP